jgi:hypothetical protein
MFNVKYWYFNYLMFVTKYSWRYVIATNVPLYQQSPWGWLLMLDDTYQRINIHVDQLCWNLIQRKFSVVQIAATS